MEPAPASLSVGTPHARRSDEWRPLACTWGPRTHDRGSTDKGPAGGLRRGALLVRGRPDASLETRDPRLLPALRSHDRGFEAGAELFGIGASPDCIHNLIDGWVALYTLLEDGRRQIVQFALPGALFGIFGATGERATYGAQALTDGLVCVIPHPVLTSSLREDSEVAMRLLRSLSRDRTLAFDHLTSIGRRNARERVACLILELFVRRRAQWPGSRIEEMYLPLTQEHLGDATGLTFVHVNRVLRGLRREGVVEFHHRRLRILDPDRLVEVAGVDYHAAMAWL